MDPIKEFNLNLTKNMDATIEEKVLNDLWAEQTEEERQLLLRDMLFDVEVQVIDSNSNLHEEFINRVEKALIKLGLKSEIDKRIKAEYQAIHRKD